MNKYVQLDIHRFVEKNINWILSFLSQKKKEKSKK